MKKITTRLNSIPKDKWQHFCLGFAIAPWPYLLFNLLVGFWAGIIASVITVVAIAKGKEVYDRRNDGMFDWMDFFATVAGGAIFWVVFLLERWVK